MIIPEDPPVSPELIVRAELGEIIEQVHKMSKERPDNGDAVHRIYREALSDVMDMLLERMNFTPRVVLGTVQGYSVGEMAESPDA